MGYSARNLDKHVTLQRLMQTDDHGDMQQKMSDVISVPAQYREMRGYERMLSGATISQTIAHFVIRFASNVSWLSPKDAVKYKDEDGIERTYDIQDIAPIGRRQWLEITGLLRDSANEVSSNE
jgi:head-tail adaptor